MPSRRSLNTFQCRQAQRRQKRKRTAEYKPIQRITREGAYVQMLQDGMPGANYSQMKLQQQRRCRPQAACTCTHEEIRVSLKMLHIPCALSTQEERLAVRQSTHNIYIYIHRQPGHVYHATKIQYTCARVTTRLMIRSDNSVARDLRVFRL